MCLEPLTFQLKEEGQTQVGHTEAATHQREEQERFKQVSSDRLSLSAPKHFHSLNVILFLFSLTSTGSLSGREDDKVTLKFVKIQSF